MGRSEACADPQRSGSSAPPDRGHALTFVVGGEPVAVPVRPAPRRGPRLRRQPPGAGACGPATTSRSSGPTSRPLVTAIQAVWLAGATVVVLPAADAAGLDRGVRRPDPAADHQRRRRRCVLVDPELAAVRRAACRATRRWSAGTLSSPAARLGAGRLASARSTTPTALAILQFTSGSTVGPEGRDAPAPHGRREPRRHRRGRPRSTPTTTSSCRGCRCTTTWASSGCSRSGLTTGTPLVLGAPHRLHVEPRPLDGVDLHLRRHRHGRPELLLRARRPRPAARRRSSTCPACASR